MALTKGLKRLQGFIVKKGNPKNIKGYNREMNTHMAVATGKVIEIYNTL